MAGPLLRLQGAKKQKHELESLAANVFLIGVVFFLRSSDFTHLSDTYISVFTAFYLCQLNAKERNLSFCSLLSLIRKYKMFRKFCWVCNNVLKIGSFVRADWSTKVSGVLLFPASLLIHTFGNWREVMYNEKCLLCCVSLAIPYYSQSSIHPFWMYSWIRCITNWCSGFSSLGIWYLVQQHWRGNDWHLVLSVRFITHRKLKINNNIYSDFIYFLHMN